MRVDIRSRAKLCVLVTVAVCKVYARVKCTVKVDVLYVSQFVAVVLTLQQRTPSGPAARVAAAPRMLSAAIGGVGRDS